MDDFMTLLGLGDFDNEEEEEEKEHHVNPSTTPIPFTQTDDETFLRILLNPTLADAKEESQDEPPLALNPPSDAKEELQGVQEAHLEPEKEEIGVAQDQWFVLKHTTTLMNYFVIYNFIFIM